MKQTIFLLLQIITFSVFANQPSDINAKKEAVEIVNTSSRAVFLIETFFTKGITKSILQQITQEELNIVKAHCNESTYPQCFQDLIAFSMDEGAAEKAEEVIKSLKVYRIAKFDNIRNGENFGEQSILWVPAAENQNIGGSCNPEEDFYIIIYSRDIKVLD